MTINRSECVVYNSHNFTDVWRGVISVDTRTTLLHKKCYNYEWRTSWLIHLIKEIHGMDVNIISNICFWFNFGKTFVYKYQQYRTAEKHKTSQCIFYRQLYNVAHMHPCNKKTTIFTAIHATYCQQGCYNVVSTDTLIKTYSYTS